jgi:hypothetical protein
MDGAVGLGGSDMLCAVTEPCMMRCALPLRHRFRYRENVDKD